MAIYYFNSQPISRGDGRRATAAAAYRAGERIRDEISGRLYNHADRRDVAYKEIVLPAAAGGVAMDWARDRSQLWNTAERAERRSNSRVAREYLVALPSELDAARRLQLARTFSREISERYRVAVDLAVHEPRAGGDPRNHHAHLLATTRQVSPSGFGAKAGLEMSSAERALHGLYRSGIDELVAIRERWATLANEALYAAGLDLRIDHRTLAAQGVDRAPRAHLPWAAYRMERQGLRSEIAERVRAGYAKRVAARRERLSPAQDLETVRGEARREWLALRAQAGQEAAIERMAGRNPGQSRDLGQNRDPVSPREPDRGLDL